MVLSPKRELQGSMEGDGSRGSEAGKATKLSRLVWDMVSH